MKKVNRSVNRKATWTSVLTIVIISLVLCTYCPNWRRRRRRRKFPFPFCTALEKGFEGRGRRRRKRKQRRRDEERVGKEDLRSTSNPINSTTKSGKKKVFAWAIWPSLKHTLDPIRTTVSLYDSLQRAIFLSF